MCTPSARSKALLCTHFDKVDQDAEVGEADGGGDDGGGLGGLQLAGLGACGEGRGGAGQPARVLELGSSCGRLAHAYMVVVLAGGWWAAPAAPHRAGPGREVRGCALLRKAPRFCRCGPGPRGSVRRPTCEQGHEEDGEGELHLDDWLETGWRVVSGSAEGRMRFVAARPPSHGRKMPSGFSHADFDAGAKPQRAGSFAVTPDAALVVTSLSIRRKGPAPSPTRACPPPAARRPPPGKKLAECGPCCSAGRPSLLSPSSPRPGEVKALTMPKLEDTWGA